jgi:hypothetical protein
MQLNPKQKLLEYLGHGSGKSFLMLGVRRLFHESLSRAMWPGDFILPD